MKRSSVMFGFSAGFFVLGYWASIAFGGPWGLLTVAPMILCGISGSSLAKRGI